MKKVTRILALLLVCMMIVSIAACGSSNSNSNSNTTGAGTNTSGGESNASGGNSNTAGGNSNTSSSPTTSGGTDSSAPKNDTLKVALDSDSGTLDAAIMTGSVFSAVACVMEPLWDVTLNNDIIFVLAESVDQVSDTQYTVNLRKNVTFSNGNPLTASDVVFSIKQHYAAGATGMPRVQTIDAEKTNAAGETTLDLHLLAPSIAHWGILCQMLVYDEESYDATKAASYPIGTGPYILTEYVPNSSVTLERREDYWGKKPDAKYINFKILSEPAQRVNALETGLVDITNIATSDVSYVEGLSGFEAIGRYAGMYCSIGFNHGEKSAFYRNVDARSAITHAIDPQVILNAVFLGHGVVMGAAVPDYCFDYEARFTKMDDTYAIGYNTDLAKQLAESSGLTSRPLKLMTNGTADAVKTAEIVQSMMRDIGVTVEINNYDPATVWQMQYDPNAEYDFSIGSGIAPNRRVGDLLLNGVRYSPFLTVPGAFENNEEYLVRAPLCMSTLDEAELSDLLFDMLGQYEKSVLSYALVDYLSFSAYSSNVDINSVVNTFGTAGVRLVDVKLAG